MPSIIPIFVLVQGRKLFFSILNFCGKVWRKWVNPKFLVFQRAGGLGAGPLGIIFFYKQKGGKSTGGAKP